MKNVLLVSFVALLGIVGGAYTFLTSEKINSFAEYLPEPIAAFMTGTVQDIDSTESVEQSQIQAVENISAFKTNQVVEEVIEVENIETSKLTQPIQGQVTTKTEKVDILEEKPVATIDDKQLIVDKVASLASKKTTKNEKPSVEVLELESQIQNIEKSIGQLDGENTALEERFQKILKKNRALAIKLKKIDEQIKISSE